MAEKAAGASSPLKVGLIAAGSTAAIIAAGVAVYVLGFKPTNGTPEVPATLGAPSASATASSANPTPASDVVARGVTTGSAVPPAKELDAAALDSVGGGWVLSMFDTGSYDAASTPTPDTRILYLISPDATLYEAGKFSAGQLADVVAWNVGKDKALLSVDEFGLATFDIKTNKLGQEWMPCGTHSLDIRVAARPDGNWQVRGSCAGAQLDGVYTDTGGAVNDPAFVPSVFGRWATDINGGVVIYDYDTKKFLATASGVSDPTEIATPPGQEYCWPLANGRGTSLSVGCYARGQVSAWELDTTGGAPTQLAPWSQIDEFANNTSGGSAPDVTTLAGSCVVGKWEALEVSSYGRAAGFAAGPNMTMVSLPSKGYAQYCWGSHGSVGLFSGYGNLWTYTAEAGTTVPLIQVNGLGDGGGPIGVGLTRSIIAP